MGTVLFVSCVGFAIFGSPCRVSRLNIALKPPEMELSTFASTLALLAHNFPHNLIINSICSFMSCRVIAPALARPQ